MHTRMYMHRYEICELVSRFEIAAILLYIIVVAICFLAAGCVLRNRLYICIEMFIDMFLEICLEMHNDWHGLFGNAQ